jgi:hypothetical protein
MQTDIPLALITQREEILREKGNVTNQTLLGSASRRTFTEEERLSLYVLFLSVYAVSVYFLLQALLN